MTRTFTEPTLDDLLTDPLVHLVMKADGLSRALVREWMETIRQARAKGPRPSERRA
ncbi:MAG: hypothetical protein NVV72_09530 [Asticcacaulis sp.]|nr:hypothetical protein [Asticcacaulis sp.]